MTFMLMKAVWPSEEDDLDEILILPLPRDANFRFFKYKNEGVQLEDLPAPFQLRMRYLTLRREPKQILGICWELERSQLVDRHSPQCGTGSGADQSVTFTKRSPSGNFQGLKPKLAYRIGVMV